METITITCQGHKSLPIDILQPLLGDLKALSEAQYEKLKQSILHHGFAFPVNVAHCNNKLIGIIDAHQWFKVVQRLLEEGYTLIQNGKQTNKLPVTYTECANVHDAALLILQAPSRYGEVTQDGLHQFVEKYAISQEELGEFTLPEFDEDDFENIFNPAEEDIGAIEPWTLEETYKPFWIVIRGPIDKVHEVQERIKDVENLTVVSSM